MFGGDFINYVCWFTSFSVKIYSWFSKNNNKNAEFDLVMNLNSMPYKQRRYTRARDIKFPPISNFNQMS